MKLLSVSVMFIHFPLQKKIQNKACSICSGTPPFPRFVGGQNPSLASAKPALGTCNASVCGEAWDASLCYTGLFNETDQLQLNHL